MASDTFPFFHMLPELQNLVAGAMSPTAGSLFAFSSKSSYQFQMKRSAIRRSGEMISACAFENCPRLIVAICDEFDCPLHSTIDLLQVCSLIVELSLR